MTDCIICGIVSGEVPTRKIYEDNAVLSFLDINPASEGHALVVPKKHYESIEATPAETLADVLAGVKKVAEMLKEKEGAEGVNVLLNNGKIAGQLISHVHFHVIPRKTGDGLAIAYYIRQNMTPEQLDAVQKKLTQTTSKLKSIRDEWDRGF